LLQTKYTLAKYFGREKVVGLSDPGRDMWLSLG
jgi:hypothetical protein